MGSAAARSARFFGPLVGSPPGQQALKALSWPARPQVRTEVQRTVLARDGDEVPSWWSNEGRIRGRLRSRRPPLHAAVDHVTSASDIHASTPSAGQGSEGSRPEPRARRGPATCPSRPAARAEVKVRGIGESRVESGREADLPALVGWPAARVPPAVPAPLMPDERWACASVQHIGVVTICGDTAMRTSSDPARSRTQRPHRVPSRGERGHLEGDHPVGKRPAAPCRPADTAAAAWLRPLGCGPVPSSRSTSCARPARSRGAQESDERCSGRRRSPSGPCRAARWCRRDRPSRRPARRWPPGSSRLHSGPAVP